MELKPIYLITRLGILVSVSILIGSMSSLFLWGLEQIAWIRGDAPWLLYGLPLVGIFFHVIKTYPFKFIHSNANNLVEQLNDPSLQIAPQAGITGIYAIASTWLSHLVGASVGREGTAVLFGGNVAQITLQKLNCSSQEKSIWIRAGMAAGFSAVFGTPLAGCFFGLEIGTVGKIHWRSLIACASTSFLANSISLHVWGTKHLFYPLVFLPQISMLFWAKLICIGLFLGIIGLLYKRLESNISKLLGQLPKQTILKGLISGLILFILFQIPTFKMSIGLGSEFLLQPFQEAYSNIEFAGSKLLATTLSLALGFKGGEATPLFLIGSHASSSLSEWIQLPHAFLAAIGFVSLYCGLTKTPITGLCLGIELFGPSAWACYLIVTCLVMYLSGNTGLYKSQKVANWIPKTPYQ